jgi:hypothetical protein
MNSLLYQHHYSLSETVRTRTQYLRTKQNITKATITYIKSKILPATTFQSPRQTMPRDSRQCLDKKADCKRTIKQWRIPIQHDLPVPLLSHCCSCHYMHIHYSRVKKESVDWSLCLRSQLRCFILLSLHNIITMDTWIVTPFTNKLHYQNGKSVLNPSEPLKAKLWHHSQTKLYCSHACHKPSTSVTIITTEIKIMVQFKMPSIQKPVCTITVETWSPFKPGLWHRSSTVAVVIW